MYQDLRVLDFSHCDDFVKECNSEVSRALEVEDERDATDRERLTGCCFHKSAKGKLRRAQPQARASPPAARRNQL
jgi:hypothetical protein